MSEHDERKSDNKGVDFLGLFLSGVGGLFFVSILLSFGDRQPKDMLWTAPVVGLIDALGRIPGLLVSGGVAALGTALFLGVRLALGRTLLGLCGVAVGLALLVGAVVPGHGGLLGATPLDLLGLTAGRLVGALLGLVVLAVSAIAAWFSGAAAGQPPRAADAAGAGGALVPTLRSRRGGEGVSAAEAHALAPAPPVAPPRAPEPAREPRAAAIPPSPYPPDARLEGKLPPGTRPLEGDRAFVPQPPRRSDPLADEAPPAKTFAEPRPVEARATTEGATAAPLQEAPGGPVIPSWERARHVRVEPADPWEEPRTSAPATAAPAEQARTAEAVAAPGPSATADEVAPAPEKTPAKAPTKTPAKASTKTPAKASAKEPAKASAKAPAKATTKGKTAGDASKVTAPQPAAWEQVGLFDADEPAAEEPEERSEPEPDPSPLALVEEEVDDEEVDEEELDEEDEAEALYDEDEDDEEEEDEDEDEEEYAEDAEYEEEDDEEDEEDEDEDEEEYAEAEEEEDDEEDEEDEEEEEEDEDLAASAEEPDAVADEEPERVIQAAAPPKAASTTSRSDLEELIHEAGCLVIEQNRVAVSMLQRSFQIDFDQACLVLDQLQERGLIGPYMGGRTRDILLTREEWLAQAPTA